MTSPSHARPDAVRSITSRNGSTSASEAASPLIGRPSTSDARQPNSSEAVLFQRATVPLRSVITTPTGAWSSRPSSRSTPSIVRPSANQQHEAVGGGGPDRSRQDQRRSKSSEEPFVLVLHLPRNRHRVASLWEPAHETPGARKTCAHRRARQIAVQSVFSACWACF